VTRAPQLCEQCTPCLPHRPTTPARASRGQPDDPPQPFEAGSDAITRTPNDSQGPMARREHDPPVVEERPVSLLGRCDVSANRPTRPGEHRMLGMTAATVRRAARVRPAHRTRRPRRSRRRTAGSGGRWRRGSTGLGPAGSQNDSTHRWERSAEAGPVTATLPSRHRRHDRWRGLRALAEDLPLFLTAPLYRRWHLAVGGDRG
jgi:hypothetical protein